MGGELSLLQISLYQLGDDDTVSYASCYMLGCVTKNFSGFQLSIGVYMRRVEYV